MRRIHQATDAHKVLLADDDAVLAAFLRLVRRGAPAVDALWRMHRHGLLAAVLPAFGQVFVRMPYDLYHVYTVDEHPWRGLRPMARLSDPAARGEVSLGRGVWRKPPTHFNAKYVDAVENATSMLGYSHRRITSGAGHDACNLNTIMPAAMVFVPCKDGISHNELEDATQSDCAAGANVLMHTVLALAGVASRRPAARRPPFRESSSTPSNRWP